MINTGWILSRCTLKHLSKTSYRHSISIANVACLTKLHFSTSNKNYKDGHANHLVGQDFLRLKSFPTDDVKQFLWTAKDLKTRMKDNGEVFQPLKGKTAALIFQKRSTRTRLSTELGMAKLGGHACFLGPEDIHLGVNESVKDSARVLACMADIILARVYGQEILDELADESKVPVVSGLSDLLHPLQILADVLTLQEHFGYLKGLKIAWVGDGNNVLHSLMYGCAKLGINLNIATPKGYEPDQNIIAEAQTTAKTTGASVVLGNDPVKAVYQANVVVTDTWVSMGQEEEKKRRLKDFAGYQVDRKMAKDRVAWHDFVEVYVRFADRREDSLLQLSLPSAYEHKMMLQGADKNWVFLHCLPRKQEEVTDDVFYSKQSIVWQEAENRMWTVMAVMLHLLQPYKPATPAPRF